MRPVTVNELADYFSRIRLEDGDRVVLVSDDEECNGFHPLFAEDIKKGKQKVYVGDDISYIDERTGESVTAETLVLF